MHIASDSHMDRDYIRSLITALDLIRDYKIDRTKKFTSNKTGSLKWIVTEYENLRILRIIETDKTIFVLTKSRTRLENTVENILGYYYDLDEVPKAYSEIPYDNFVNRIWLITIMNDTRNVIMIMTNLWNYIQLGCRI